jgi:cation diffusion facilitator family transporter
MMKLSRRMADWLAPGHADPAKLDARTRVGLLEGWISIVLNTLLGAVKVWLALMTGSLALLADAFHTLADSVTSAVVVLGFRMARKPADAKHPFGHGRVESVASVVIAVLLGVVAVEMGKEAVGRLLHPRAVTAASWIMVVLLIAMLIKEVLAQLSMDWGKLIGSDALIADGWHHRSDVLATGLVIVAFLGSRWNLMWLDGAMGLGVAALIGWAAVVVMRESVGPLLGESAGEETYRAIGQIALSVRGVKGVHDVMVHKYGATHVISLNVEVVASQSPLALHELSETIEEAIARRFPGHAVVHVDPVDRSHAHYAEVEQVVKAAAAGCGQDCWYHDLRLRGGRESFNIALDVSLPPGRSKGELEDCCARIAERIQAAFPNSEVRVNAEPPYAQRTPDKTAD